MHLHLTEKAPMVSIPNVISVMSCGVLLCLGLSSAAQADNAASVQDEMKADQSDLRQGGQAVGEKQMSDEMKGGQSKSGMTIKAKCCESKAIHTSKGQDGKEVRLRTIYEGKANRRLSCRTNCR